MAQKEAIVVCLDVGRTMFDPKTQGESRAHTKLYEAQQALSLFLQHKIADGRRTEQVGLVLFGCDESKNSLNYPHVSVQYTIQMATVEMVRFIENDVKGCNNDSDWIDALLVAMDMLENHPAHMAGWRTYARRVILVTDAGCDVNKDSVDVILGELKDKAYKLQIFGLDFDDPDYPIKTLPHKSDVQLRNEELLQSWAAGKVDDMDVIPMTDALQRLSWFRARAIRQTSLYRGFLEVAGDALRIPVHLFTKTAEAKPKSFKRVFVEDDGTPVDVTMERTYKRVEDDEPVERDDLVKAYKYGRTYVPFDRADQALEFNAEKCLMVSGFVRSDEVPLTRFLGSTSSGTVEVDPQPNDPNAAYALSAMVHALYELDRVALVRYKKNNGKGGPIVGVLTPHITPKRECLFFTRLPFAEDIREYTFVSLEKSRPTNAQQAAMDAFVDSLDLMTAARDPSGDPMEDLKPSNTPNVVLHRILEAIKCRAIYKNSRPLPLTQPALDKVLERNRQLWHGAADTVAKLESSFKLTKTEAAAKKDAQQQWAAAKVEDDAKKPQLDGEMDLAKLADQAVDTVGSMDPVGDFRRIIGQRNADRVASAMDQLASIVKTLVTNSFGDANFDKALEAVQELRKAAIVEEESARFNNLLTTLKGAPWTRPSAVPWTKPNGARFWDRLVRANVTLISSDEADDSSVPPQASQDFIKTDSTPRASVKMDSVPTADSLLDELE